MKNSKQIFEPYLKGQDWRVKENSNSPYCYGGLNKYAIAEISKDYWLHEVYPDNISKAYVDGYMHIHDLGGLTLYCCGYSLHDIIEKGVRGVPNIPTSKPAKHFDAILNQCANLITVFQNEIMGAVALNSFDTLLAPFVKKDGLTFDQVKQNIQNYVFSVNSNSRAGAEPAFSNLTFDLTPPRDLKNDLCLIGGELMDFTYEDCQNEMDMINKAFCEVMIAGDANGKLFAYPIPTYNIHSQFDWDNPNNDLIFEMAGKYGVPYFANFINSDMDVSDARSMCPMTPDTKVIVKSNDSIEEKSIKDVYDDYINNKMIYNTWTPNGWAKCVPVRTPKTKVYNILFENGESVKLGKNHLQPTRDYGTLHADELKEGMAALFNINYTDFKYYNIISIEEVKYTGDYLYCFEVDNDDHLFTLANGLVTHNCRLRLDLRELRRRNGGLFGSGDSTGSIGVVTINLPRVGYETKGDKNAFYKLLDQILDIAKDSLEIKRNWLQENVIDTHLIPAFIEYVGTLDNHFSTIGIVGMNEMCENFLGTDIVSDDGHKFAHEVGEHIRNKLVEYQQETGHLYNYEATPAESTCYRLALIDKNKYGDAIITRGSGDGVYYTNSCHIPVSKIKGIDSTFAHQEDLQTQFTGGTVIHCYLNGAISKEAAKQTVKSMFAKYKVPYMSLSPISRYCDEHGYISQTVDNCPTCGARLKKYQRITGYLRCVDNFNNGKAAEFNDRVQL